MKLITKDFRRSVHAMVAKHGIDVRFEEIPGSPDRQAVLYCTECGEAFGKNLDVESVYLDHVIDLAIDMTAVAVHESLRA